MRIILINEKRGVCFMTQIDIQPRDEKDPLTEAIKWRKYNRREIHGNEKLDEETKKKIKDILSSVGIEEKEKT